MRREWIEMTSLKKDHNKIKASPSMRREWIEMLKVGVFFCD